MRGQERINWLGMEDFMREKLLRAIDKNSKLSSEDLSTKDKLASRPVPVC